MDRQAEEEKIRRWEKALEDRGLDADLRAEIGESITARGGQSWSAKGLLELLKVAQMEAALVGDSGDIEFEQALADGMGAAMPHREEWNGGVLMAQREALARQYGREKRKAELVGQRMEEANEGRRKEIAKAYLATDPEQGLRQGLEERFVESFEEARRVLGQSLEALVDDRRLLEWLRFEEDDGAMNPAAARASLEALHQRWDGAPRLLKEQILGDDEEGRLAAAGLALVRGEQEMGKVMLRALMQGLGPAGPLAAFAGVLDEEASRDGLGRFLVDALNDDTPREELVVEASRLAEAMAAARAILPYVGSPLEELESPSKQAEKTVKAAQRAWRFAAALHGQESPKAGQ